MRDNFIWFCKVKNRRVIPKLRKTRRDERAKRQTKLLNYSRAISNWIFSWCSKLHRRQTVILEFGLKTENPIATF